VVEAEGEAVVEAAAVAEVRSRSSCSRSAIC
jgi:hypothetical protein